MIGKPKQIHATNKIMRQKQSNLMTKLNNTKDKGYGTGTGSGYGHWVDIDDNKIPSTYMLLHIPIPRSIYINSCGKQKVISSSYRPTLPCIIEQNDNTEHSYSILSNIHKISFYIALFLGVIVVIEILLLLFYYAYICHGVDSRSLK
jgi:hypothetical protein